MEHRLDKTTYKKQSLAEADNNRPYWLTKSMDERLEAGYHLSLRAYGYDPRNPPKMDKNYFVKRKRQ